METEANDLKREAPELESRGCGESIFETLLAHPRRQLGLILLLTVLVTVPSMFTRDLWNPDEPRYMEVAREMVVLDSYVIPHLSGEIYSEKPPVWFWGTAALWRLGLGYNSGRILTMLAVMGVLAMTWRFVRSQAGARAGLLAALVTLTTVFVLDIGKLGVLDPLLTLFTTGAILCGYAAFHAQGRRLRLLWYSAYALAGLATITKGPVGLAVPLLVLLAYGIVDRQRVRAGGWAHLVGFGVCLAVISAWVVPACVMGGEEYTDTILFEQNLGRAVSSDSHRNPIYFYLTVAPWRLFPWILLLVPAVISTWRLWKRERDQLSLFSLLWLVVPVLFFSLMSGKRDRYILPIVPAAGILCGRYLVLKAGEGVRFPRADRWLLSIGLGIVGLTAGFLGAAIFAVRYLPALHDLAVGAGDGEAAQVLNALAPWHVAAAVALGSAALCLFIAAVVHRTRPVSLAFGTVAATMLLSLTIDVSVTPAFNAVKSGKKFGLRVRELSEDGAIPVYLYRSEYSGVYNLYSGIVRMPILRNHGDNGRARDELTDVLSTGDALVIGNEERFRNAFSPAELTEFAVYEERVGHRRMLVLRGNRPATSD